jgi:hypothetical protein
MSKNMVGVVVIVAVVMIVMAWFCGVGVGENRKLAQMREGTEIELTMKAHGQLGAVERNCVDLACRIADLEAKDKAHEASLDGAAKRLFKGDNDLIVTRGMMGLIEKCIIKHVGLSKWEKSVHEARAEIEAENKKIAQERAKAAKARADSDAALLRAVRKVKAESDAKAKATKVEPVKKAEPVKEAGK